VAAGRVVASELVLLSGNAAYSFLGGTDSAAFRLSPNHLLKVEIIRWAAAQGKQWFVLGGGFQPNDGIFQYKRGFAPRGVISFHVGCKVRDEERCNRLIDARRRYGERNGQVWLPRPDFFPPYRA
jgi:CelD/BcsL family acetyltransferase involved in cellulose biosynthesis